MQVVWLPETYTMAHLNIRTSHSVGIPEIMLCRILMFMWFFAALNILDNRAILRMDTGIYKGALVWQLPV